MPTLKDCQKDEMHLFIYVKVSCQDTLKEAPNIQLSKFLVFKKGRNKTEKVIDNIKDTT